ncbi:unnamed protein product [Microthlaspi erraticum]|uniref:CCHC-type domain-containing protein n=1 Tax=Microthlaspi erraticum TaxID=1685480 RepID=A0A6D2HHU1_9BRAS|nr:unnamed protein product [Microthlaspi erraticum]
MVLCGENVSDYDMIEKTLSTFHPGNIVLQQQYRANGYTRYSKLMDVLLVAEQNNELVMMNHQTRPTGAAPFPEANVASSSQNNGRGRGRGYGRNRGRGRGRGRGQGKEYRPDESNNERNYKRSRANDYGRDSKKQKESVCYRCGMKNHWERTCRTPRHLADLYRESQKAKEKESETNFISNEPGPSFHGLNDDTHLDVSDFLVDSEEINGKTDD